MPQYDSDETPDVLADANQNVESTSQAPTETPGISTQTDDYSEGPVRCCVYDSDYESDEDDQCEKSTMYT